MKQVTQKQFVNKKKVKKKTAFTKKQHKQYGTSKLEERFAKEYLDALGVKYVYQFEAKDIGRFYDFYLPEENLIIEVDGDYYHSFNLTYEQMCPMQKKNKRVDALKDKWALMHSIPILRIWEHDINNNSEYVFKILSEMIRTQEKRKIIMENKKKPR